MFKHLVAIIAGTLMALATGPAFAKGQNIGQTILNLQDTLATVQETVDNLQNLLEPKTIFVTSETFTGDLVTQANNVLSTSFAASEGLEAGDALCQNLADDPGSIVPEGTYMALLSIFEEVNASARITPSSGPYLRPDGTILAANAAALFRPRLQSITHDLLSLEELIVAPEFDETGSIVVADETWTGSEDDGTAFGDSDSDCIGWTSVDGAKLGRTGLQDRVDSLWLSGANRFCDDENHLYCLQR